MEIHFPTGWKIRTCRKIRLWQNYAEVITVFWPHGKTITRLVSEDYHIFLPLELKIWMIMTRRYLSFILFLWRKIFFPPDVSLAKWLLRHLHTIESHSFQGIYHGHFPINIFTMPSTPNLASVFPETPSDAWRGPNAWEIVLSLVNGQPQGPQQVQSWALVLQK